MAFLVQKTGLLAGSIFAINRFPATLGRSPSSCDVVLNFKQISRRHARIYVENDVCLIEDLGSQNRTAINDSVINAPQPIANGDLINLGGIQFEFFFSIRSTTKSADPDLVPKLEAKTTEAVSIFGTADSPNSNQIISSAMKANDAFRNILSLLTNGIDSSISMVSSIRGGVCWYKHNLSSQVETHDVDECITQLVIKSGKPLTVDDLPNDERCSKLKDVVESPFLVSIAAYPYFQSDGVTVEGAVGLATTVKREFTEAELNRVRKFLPIVTNFFASSAEFLRLETILQQLLDDTPGLIWTSDHPECITWVNRGWIEFTGEEIASGNRSNWKEFVHPDDIPAVVSFLEYNWNGHHCQTVEFRLRSANGDYRRVEARCNPRLNIAGHVMGLIGTCIDITDELKIASELEAEKSAHKASTIFEPHFSDKTERASADENNTKRIE